MPISAFTKDPFWYDLGDLKQFSARNSSNKVSFSSSAKREFLSERHPVRPFGELLFVFCEV